MSDPAISLTSLRRPRLLVRAARLGLGDYDRARALSRLLPGTDPNAPRQVFDQLARRERECDGARRSGRADYTVARHVDLLTAMIAEARVVADVLRPQDGCAAS